MPFSVFVLARFVYLVYRQFESVVYHPGQQHLQNIRALFKTRVCICLDQPRVELSINDEIIAKYLEAFFPLVGVQLLLDR